MTSTFEFLAEYPRAARLREEIGPPVRAYPYRSHVIVYELGASDMVIVLRVRHAREDWMPDVKFFFRVIDVPGLAVGPIVGLALLPALAAGAVAATLSGGSLSIASR